MNGHYESVLHETARRWVLKLASGEISASEMQELRRWLAVDGVHREAFNHERDSWRSVGPARERLAASLPSALLARVPKRWPKLAALGVGSLLAACCALFLVTGNPLIWLKSDHSTETGDIARTTLPDGSIAVLDTDSAIAVEFADGARRVHLLKGQAWFDVVPDATRPFRVDTAGITAEAVGTAFSVSEHADGATVRVTHGVVSVMEGSGDGDGPDAVRVTAGMEAAFVEASHRIRVGRFDESVDLSWRQHRITIEQMPLEGALAELDRYRPGMILLLDKAQAGARVSGTLTVGELDHGIQALVSTQGLHVTFITPYLAVVH